MAKTTKYTAYWVKVRVDPGVLNKDPAIAHQSCLSACRQMKDEIKRHCDVDDIEIDVDHSDVCKYCGADWTEGDADNNGGCCTDDANHMFMVQNSTLLRALRLIVVQDQGAGGNVTPAECWKAARTLANDALKEVGEV